VFGADLQAKVAQAHALLADIAAEINSDTSGQVAVALLPDVLAAVRQGELVTCRLIERADRTGEYRVDGAASITAYVRQISGERGPWASLRVHLGRALADNLPMTLKTWQAGHLGMAHATVIDKATKKLTDPDLISALEAYLADLATDHTPKELAAAAEELLANATPEQTADETASKRSAQQLSLSQTLDGMWRLDGWLDAEAGLIVSTAITAFLRKRDRNGNPLEQTIGRRRADALTDVCRQAIAHNTSCQHKAAPAGATIVVGLSYEGLAAGLGTATTPNGSPLSAATVRRMACDAGIIPAVMGADSEILDYGRETRTAPPKLKKVLAVRDGGCIWPDCDLPPSFCEAHHRDQWLHGGPTSDLNNDLLCVFHHHYVHERGRVQSVVATPAAVRADASNCSKASPGVFH
jgi:hypothetical protein